MNSHYKYIPKFQAIIILLVVASILITPVSGSDSKRTLNHTLDDVAVNKTDPATSASATDPLSSHRAKVIADTVAGLGLKLLAAYLSPQTPPENLTTPTEGVLPKSPDSPNKNFIFSPVSLATVLGILYLGSGGESYRELGTLINNQNTSRKAFHSAYSTFLETVSHGSAAGNGTEGVTLLNAHKLLVKSSPEFVLNRDFVVDLSRLYGTDVEAVNFKTDGQAISDNVNAWVANRTSGMIRDIMEADSLSSSTKLVVLDAIYFYGRWALAFDPTKSTVETFYTSRDTTVRAHMMRIKGRFKSMYLYREKAMCIEIPFMGSMSFYVLLPDTPGGQDVQNLAKVLDNYSLSDILRKRPMYDMTVKIPKFSIQSDVNLKNSLSDIGLKTLFNPERANLCGMTSDSPHPLYVSDFKQKVVFGITEEGAKGGVITQAVIEARSLHEDLFLADRPFIFLVVDSKTSSLIFAGAIYEPKLEL